MTPQTITKDQYDRYKKKWTEVVPKDLTPFSSSYFKPDGKWLYGYEINIPDLKKENRDVTNVVFSFVIDTDDRNIVKIVLYGVSNSNHDPLTQYYMLYKPIQETLLVGSTWRDKNEITDQQAKDWTRVWGIFVDNDINLPATLFQVSDPRLKVGQDPRLMYHTFQYLEIPSEKTLRVYFAIHQPPSPNQRDLLTFVVQWVKDASSDDSFYDLSAPCPPCCPCD